MRCGQEWRTQNIVNDVWVNLEYLLNRKLIKVSNKALEIRKGNGVKC